MPDLHPVAVTDATFGHEVEQQKGLIVVDFWATWCGPCHMVAPILEQLAGEYQGKLKVVKLDVDANQQTAMRFNVRSIPSILFFKDGATSTRWWGRIRSPCSSRRSSNICRSILPGGP